MGIFSKKVDTAPPPVGRITAAATSYNAFGSRNPNIPSTISPYKSRNTNLLCSLRREFDVYSAIELLSEQHPDMSMAIQSYVRLANNGHKMEIFVDGAKSEYAQDMWNEFAAQPIDTNTKGFDGLIDQAHDSQIRFGGLGTECTVNRKAKSLDGVYPILPQWITWRQDSAGKWRAFQQQGTREIELTAGNFFWIALDNKVGQPTGKLLLEPSLVAIERQLQTFEDFAAVLRRIGYPRNDISIDREAFIKSLSAADQRDHKKLKEALSDYFDFIQSLLQRLSPTDDYIHFNDLIINKSQGENSRGIDARSFLEIIDPQVINGLSTMSIMLNRTTGITETWGTVQFKILVQNIQNAQRGSKRLAENICKLWLRVNGIQGTCKFTHNPVDWEAELTKLNVALKKQELHRRAEEYGHEDKLTAAKESMGITELPTTPPDTRTAYVSKDFSKSGKQQGTEETDGNA